MCQAVLLWLFLATLAAGIPEEHQYCAIRYRRLCQGKGKHVACQFPDSGPGSSCERYTQIRFTNDLKHFITHYLNRRRQRIAAGNERVRGGVHLPKPQVMMLVEWDRELALLAQRLADQCHFVHDDCRATVKFPYAGQTVGEVRWRRSSESDELSAQREIRRVLDAWWGERRRVQARQLTAPFRLTNKGSVWGHFSQLAVWNLQAVGCGAVRHGARHPRLLLVCDFSHTNMLGQRTLVPGAPAPCPIHTARRPRTAYPALCAPNKKREQPINDKFYNRIQNNNGTSVTENNIVRNDFTYLQQAGTMLLDIVTENDVKNIPIQLKREKRNESDIWTNFTTIADGFMKKDSKSDDLTAFSNYIVLSLRNLPSRHRLNAQDETHAILTKYKLLAERSNSPTTARSTQVGDWKWWSPIDEN